MRKIDKILKKVLFSILWFGLILSWPYYIILSTRKEFVNDNIKNKGEGIVIRIKEYNELREVIEQLGRRPQ